MIAIENQFLRAEFTSWRGELVRLRDSRGLDFLWNGNPDVWKGHSPILFPLVGMLPDNSVIIEGTRYTMQQHGFAPASEFSLIHYAEDQCTFRLAANHRTQALYPFNFCLDIQYAISGPALSLKATVTNTDVRRMPYSFGFHPAFNWPIPDASSRDSHVIVFEKTETAPIRRPQNGLLRPERFPTPVEGKHLRLRDELFSDGALIFDELASQKLAFEGPESTVLKISCTNLPYLGLWTRPGAGFLCIEPWQGLPSPVGFSDELANKPGILCLDPGHNAVFEMIVELVAPDH